MDSDKRSKIEVLLRILLTAQKEVQMILASENSSFEARSIPSAASERGRSSRAALARLEKAHVGLQEVMDDLEAAAGIDWVS
jgi:hypothetical protein